MKTFVFISILICGLSTSLKSQILLKNPGFDGPVCDPGCYVYDWNTCENWYGLLDSGYHSDGYPNSPFEGETFIGLAPIFSPPGYNNLPSFITQELICNLKKSKTYRFQIAVSSYRNIDISIPPEDTAFFLIKSANDSCGVNATEEMYRSAYLEYDWRKLNITITPKQDDYNYFMIYTYVDTTRSLRPSFPRLGGFKFLMQRFSEYKKMETLYLF